MRPVGRLQAQPWLQAPATRRLVAALTAAGGDVRFVGGAVRDALLGRPVGDVDAATPLAPETVLARLRAAGIEALPTGLKHGTVTALVDGHPFEVTTLRHDVETFGRHAAVAFTDDWAADAARRDLTINALYCDPDGTLYDPVGGLADIEAGRVRFVGDPARRIAEDYLRILRFFRFQAWYGRMPPERRALAACRAGAAGIDRLSGERLRQEMLRLLAAPAPLAVLRTMQRLGVLQRVLGQPVRTGGLARLLRAEAAFGTADPARRLAALLPRDGATATAVAGRLRLSRAEADRLRGLLGPRPRIVADARALRRQLHRDGRLRTVDFALLAGRADAAAAARDLALPPFPLAGADVLALGVAPGPRVGALLAAVEGWWAARDFRPGREACLARLGTLAGRQPGLSSPP